eukprot:CAMPEP_0201567468 /NCGR_PEP_ID=MMETSP0190_2-20130828/7966_1 /ASSEMBLY_ACC=CAM_ASM_000263 /TAXON_ID=37353 /ORGANISM="Rosalina sp." /LENGTH=328 /DNA_ID=CAMNT_0047987499 /DNA_START=33 /DNA_END=1016 /DNA_ORIENTATION=-
MAEKQGSGLASFKQQELKAWQPVLTPVAVIAMLLIVFVVFLPIGIVLEDCSNRVIEQSIRYDNIGACDQVTADLDHTQLPKTCELNDIELLHDFEPPIYFYYELKNFYQNHRRFTKSKSDPQLRGDGNQEQTSPACDPLEKYRSDIIVPCGLFPGSFFEDRFTMEYQLPDSQTPDAYIPLCSYTTPGDPCYFWGNNTAGWNNGSNGWSGWHVEGDWQKEGIAWTTDKESKFKFNALEGNEINQGPRQNQTGLNLPRADDEDFIVWMRAAALPDFRKLHRVIHDTRLPKGTKVNIKIASWFPTKDFGGEKWVTIAKTEWCGGANHALAW